MSKVQEEQMVQELTMTGATAAAIAAILSRVEVVSAYPITPMTHALEYIAQVIANGELNAEMLTVESEHSAMAACITASLSGARTFTGTSSQGLFLMHEMLHWAGGSRAPIVAVIGNRAVCVPWCLNVDHQDSMSQRDTGWMQFYVENNQEVLDTVIQAYRIAEDKNILLPAMVCLDGFILTHTRERVFVPTQQKIDDFLPPYDSSVFKIDADNPLSQNVVALTSSYQEFRYLQQKAMDNAKKLIKQVDDEFAEEFGRSWGGLIDTYPQDADFETAVVAMGTAASTARTAVKELRSEGKNVGLIKLRVFRPFPEEELQKICSGMNALAVIDRNCSFGAQGIAYDQIRSSMYDSKERPLILGHIAGLGGRDISVNDIKKVLTDAIEVGKIGESPKTVEWVNLKEV
jgi:2-oxoisovalerate ferredoxin oxidoreductase alpha subunit